jgi:hypothetical protein
MIKPRGEGKKILSEGKSSRAPPGETIGDFHEHGLRVDCSQVIQQPTFTPLDSEPGGSMGVSPMTAYPP